MKKVERVIINCLRGGKSRGVLPSLFKKGRGKYCSIHCARIDHPPDWMHHYEPERNLRVSRALRGRFQDEESRFWKGDNVGYRALHQWVEKKRGKAHFCSVNLNHLSSRYHWANISHKYKRNLDDWISLCPKCHGNFDREWRGGHH